MNIEKMIELLLRRANVWAKRIMSEQIKLKPCRCGAFYGYMLEGIRYGSKYEIHCMNCGERTGLKDSFEKAVKAWNRRAGEEA